MKASAEQERAEFEKAWRERPIYMGGVHQKEVAYIWWTQAARRAPAVPVPQGWKITEEMHVAAVKVLHRASGVDGLPQRMVDAMLAAAPQPPEAAQLDDIGVVDMAQAVDSKEAASVQLPEPVAKIEGGSLKWHIPDAGYSLPVRYLQGTQMLYTEQQVRQLLAEQARND